MTADPTHVVILNDHATVNGGSSAVAIASALGLAAGGVQVTFLAAVGPVAEQLRDVPNLRVVCLGEQEIARDPNRLRAFAGGLRNGRAVRAVREILASSPRETTIVHAHGWTKALSPFAPAAAAAAGFPLVLTLHDFFIACPNGGFFVHGANSLCDRRPLSGSCWRCRCDRRRHAHKLWRNARTVLQNHVLALPRRVTHYVAVSDFSLRILRPHLPAAARATVVRNPIDAAPTSPAPVSENGEFVFVGRFENEKGVRLFAEAVRATGARATFVGGGELEPAVRALCPAARFTGWLDRDGIRREVRRARALVFPPLWHETLGLVVVEAAAEGVPAIVADRSAATEHVRDRVNGLLFEHGSAAALAGRMRELAADDALAAGLGRAAYETYWRQPWTRERHVADLMRVYREAAAAPAANKEKGEIWHERARRVRTGS